MDYVAAVLRIQFQSVNPTALSFQPAQLTGGSTTDSASVQVSSSAALDQYLGQMARLCLDANNADACSGVTNLCALQQYQQDAASCVVYQALYTNKTAVAGVSSDGSAGGIVPALQHRGTLGAGNVPQRVAFSGPNSQLQFMLEVYDINGTSLEQRRWDLDFQLCGAPQADGGKWWSFGVDYLNACSLSLARIVAQRDYNCGAPKFYRPYLLYGSTTYEVPVQIAGQTNLYRRFFHVDTLLGTDRADNNTDVIQYAQQLVLTVTLRNDSTSQIYPPLLAISYAAVNNDTAAVPAALPASFQVGYVNDTALQARFWAAWQTMLIVLLVLVGAPLWIWRMMLYLRKHAQQPMDIEFLAFTVITAADCLSFALVMVTVLASVYWLVQYKLQQEVQMMMPTNDQLENFHIAVVLAIIGQSLGLVHKLYEQIRVDIMFLDWEKPRRVLAKGGGKEEASPVSCWRQLLLANEWNELQTVRLTYPSLTLLLMVLVLEGAGMIAAGDINPDQSDLARCSNIQSSMLLRFGIAASWFLVFGLGQILFKVVIYHRFLANPITQYVDLLFLANISLVILDDGHSGFYVHGRNQMRHADTNLTDLNANLLREEEGLVANRGFVPHYQNDPQLNDNQTFRIYISTEVRQKYEGTLLVKVEQAAQDQRMRRGMVRSVVHGPNRPAQPMMAAKEDVEATFKEIVGEVERNYATQVLVPSYWQRLFRLPPSATTARAIFSHDFHNSFASSVFYGNELRLYVYDALFFCAVDLAIQNVPVAAFLTYVMIRVVTYVRAHFAEQNISKKTLIDSHFLI